jgi:SAM-dependent methyltransferase
MGLRSAMHATMAPYSREEIGFRDADCCSHAPSYSYYAFRAVLNRFVRPTKDDVFLDYGSGLGNVLLMAATFPFREVIGVEYSQKLHDAAAQIIRQAESRLKCRNIQLVVADASTYDLPNDVTVIYFFNPFRGLLLRKVIENIRRSLVECPRRVRIVYNTPDDFERAIHGCDWLVKKGDAMFPALSRNSTVVYESRLGPMNR